jgi:hypothetical protein
MSRSSIKKTLPDYYKEGFIIPLYNAPSLVERAQGAKVDKEAYQDNHSSSTELYRAIGPTKTR